MSLADWSLLFMGIILVVMVYQDIKEYRIRKRAERKRWYQWWNGLINDRLL